ncbi:YihA family ribosome biogenesis GTP-binding protein [Persicimonas caeni]|jgi:GTP-binding protein|uniref:Probable GTP-binding protein EngB n=1 Tax=Persicimonas caeni TaxID=2292766 RepID=A0A4Y6Q0V1_PERCE|nr:ribosome biogenesis GTP-binding protein YihA/YsxC [Persicimonas caeni]QDG54218.1 YihA family ribosome biogenesis GTP-binding protein [Persicimonas caeni]QED35439.1 YihA family ribosome biogenesis GTP-binding protein [Persicimonas caeni]
MKITKAEFIKSATQPEHFPPADKPEVAFAGRSNVGKSSLINTLLNRKKLVKVSGRPGHTQLVNFFNINDQLYFVDLPGYGFAKVPKEVKDAWGPMIEGYLANRPNLTAMVCIMDVRRGVQEDDFELIHAAPHFGVQPILVFTKADKLNKQKKKQRRIDIANEFGVHKDDIILFSSLNRTGVDRVWRRIEELTGLGNG